MQNRFARRFRAVVASQAGARYNARVVVARSQPGRIAFMASVA